MPNDEHASKATPMETRAEVTDRAARAILAAERERREAKTKRLRRQRLARERDRSGGNAAPVA